LAAKDYYEVLGVNKGSSQEEIQGAYRRLVMQFHPDVNKEANATQKMSEINEAYNTLSDPDKRKKYDMYGEAGLNMDQTGDYGGYSGNTGDFFRGGSSGSIFDDILNNFFSGGSSQSDTFYRQNIRQDYAARGTDISFETQLTLEEAITGKKIKVELDRYETCSSCEGSGAKKGSASETCPKCKGSGQVTVIQSNGFMQFRTVAVCPDCKGKGKLIKEPCPSCKGTGRTRVKKILDLDIPPGINDGTKIRYRGFGNAAENGGATGDLYLYIKLKRHPFFERDENDLLFRAVISYPKAVIGTTIDIPTLYGEEKLKIPPGTESGRSFILKNKGLPSPGNISRKGKLTVLVTIKVPSYSQLDKEGKKILEDLDKKLN
jgi:molecular chaperone DnaJ